MKVAYFDCIGGASGDMLLAAIVSAGADEAIIQKSITSLHLPNCSLVFSQIRKNGFNSTISQVSTPARPTSRHPQDLLKILQKAKLSNRVKDKALECIRVLAKAESKIHGLPINKIHLHELGGDDTLIDIVGTLAGLESLKIDKIYVSPLPLARGITSSDHGSLPLPAPATLELLKGIPVHYLDSVQAELVTPTGALLLTSIANNWGGFPNMKLTGSVGIGAGKKEFPFPNIIRLWLGESDLLPGKDLIQEKLAVLETNIDDMNPQILGFLSDKLFALGVFDVTFTPIQMKKNRPATTLSVLCSPADVEKVQSVVFSETSTLGIKIQQIDRVSLPRVTKTVSTKYGKIRLKISKSDFKTQVTPEYEDCVQAANKFNKSLLDIMATARSAHHERK